MRIVNKFWIVIFVIIIGWIYYIFISPYILYKKEIVVPDVVGVSEEQVRKVLDENGIKYNITYVQDSKEVVLKTIPYAGVNIKTNSVIDVYVGCIFPRSYKGYLGLVYDDVRGEIDVLCNDYGINLVIEYVDDDSLISGVIVGESIREGSIIESGATLILTISKNNSFFVMPNLVGLDIYDALKILDEYNIKAIINYYSSPISDDVVLFQSISKDSIIKKGNQYEITLYVSKGIV